VSSLNTRLTFTAATGRARPRSECRAGSRNAEQNEAKPRR
jgi:hypothetical protein